MSLEALYFLWFKKSLCRDYVRYALMMAGTGYPFSTVQVVKKDPFVYGEGALVCIHDDFCSPVSLAFFFGGEQVLVVVRG